jgi:hypothetical protein
VRAEGELTSGDRTEPEASAARLIAGYQTERDSVRFRVPTHDPIWGMQCHGPNHYWNYYWDPYPNLHMHGNRLGGVNYWARNGSSVGFSADHAATNRYVYFDGIGRRIP